MSVASTLLGLITDIGGFLHPSHGGRLASLRTIPAGVVTERYHALKTDSDIPCSTLFEVAGKRLSELGRVDHPGQIVISATSFEQVYRNLCRILPVNIGRTLGEILRDPGPGKLLIFTEGWQPVEVYEMWLDRYGGVLSQLKRFDSLLVPKGTVVLCRVTYST